jgi:hypothetical protein
VTLVAAFGFVLVAALPPSIRPVYSIRLPMAR